MFVLKNLLRYNLLYSTTVEKDVMLGLSRAIHQYLHIQRINLKATVHPSVGVVNGITPAASLVGADIPLLPREILYTKLKQYTRSSAGLFNPIYHIGIFRAIKEYLEMHFFRLTSGIPLSSPLGVGNFNPIVMNYLGIPCWLTMLHDGLTGNYWSSTEDILNRPLEIFSNFIFLGLNLLFSPPVNTLGSLGGSYLGLSFVRWTFIDFDYEFDFKEVFGIDSLEDIEVPEEDPVEPDSCVVSFNGESYECPFCDGFSEEILEAILDNPENNSGYTSEGGDLCSQITSKLQEHLQNALEEIETPEDFDIEYTSVDLGVMYLKTSEVIINTSKVKTIRRLADTERGLATTSYF